MADAGGDAGVAPTQLQVAPGPAFQPPNGNTYHDKFPLKGTLDCLVVGCSGKDVFDGASVITHCTYDHVTCGICHCQYNKGFCRNFFDAKNHRTDAQCRLTSLCIGQPPDHARREELASLSGPSAELMSKFELAVREAGYTDGEVMDLNSKNAFLQILREYCGSSDALRTCCFSYAPPCSFQPERCGVCQHLEAARCDQAPQVRRAEDEAPAPDEHARGPRRVDPHGPQRAGSPQALRAEPGRLAGLGASLDVKTKSWVEVDGTLRQRLRV